MVRHSQNMDTACHLGQQPDAHSITRPKAPLWPLTLDKKGVKAHTAMRDHSTSQGAQAGTLCWSPTTCLLVTPSVRQHTCELVQLPHRTYSKANVHRSLSLWTNTQSSSSHSKPARDQATLRKPKRSRDNPIMLLTGHIATRGTTPQFGMQPCCSRVVLS